MNKPTLGPWSIDGLMINYKNTTICTMVSIDSFGGIGDAHNSESNAKLISASPDLLDALVKLVEDLELRAKIGQRDAKGVVACGNGVYIKAKSAIAKAQGSAS